MEGSAFLVISVSVHMDRDSQETDVKMVSPL